MELFQHNLMYTEEMAKIATNVNQKLKIIQGADQLLLPKMPEDNKKRYTKISSMPFS